MDKSNLGCSPNVLDGALTVDQLARKMVKSIDRILDYLMVAVPTEEAEGEVSLTFQEVRAMKIVGARGSVTMSTLASLLGVSLPTTTHLVDRLVAKGVTVRIRPEHDRRLVLVALSDPAKVREQVLSDNRVAVCFKILEPLDPAERERVVKALGDLSRVVRSYEAGQVKDTDSQ